MSHTSRRTFIMQVAAAGSTALVASRTMAQAKVDEATDATAKSLDYKSDSTKVDLKKYPKHVAATDKCGTCALYQGKPGDAAGPCPLFAGKVVAATGWCSAWAKKAG